MRDTYVVSLSRDDIREVVTEYLENYGIPTEFIAFIGGAILMFMLILSIFFIVSYILGSIGLYTMAKNKGYENPWIAWIPVVNTYLTGKVAFSNIGSGWMYLLFSVICLIFKLPSEALLIQLVALVVAFFLFRRYSKKYMLFTILNAITFGLAFPFITFSLRNNKEIENI